MDKEFEKYYKEKEKLLKEHNLIFNEEQTIKIENECRRILGYQYDAKGNRIPERKFEKSEFGQFYEDWTKEELVELIRNLTTYIELENIVKEV